MRAEGAPARVPMYGNVAFDPKGSIQGTGGSTSMASSWQQLREAGATARAMFVGAAAKRWGVPASEIAVSEGVVSHSSGRRATFGELASDAARQPVPKEVKLKDASQYKLIGRDKLPRLDSRAKSTGTQQFAIDVSLPGMMTAVVMRPPRFGAKVKSFDATAAKAVPGVVDVVQIPRGVAVVGRDTHAAKKGREALEVTWDESAAEIRGTDELMAEYKRLAASGEGSLSAIKKGDAAAGLKGAYKTINAEFELPYLAHAPMEPLTAVCRLSVDRCEIWAGAQFQTIDQLNAAGATGLKPDQVVINSIAAGWHFRPSRQRRVRLHRRGGFHCQGDGRQVSRSSHLDARRRPRRRPLSPAELSPHHGRHHRRRKNRRLPAARGRPVHRRRHCVRGNDERRHRPDGRRRQRSGTIRDRELAAHVDESEGGRSGAVVALGRALAHGVLERGHRRRTGGGRGQRPRRVPACDAREESARRCGSEARGAESRLGQALRQEQGPWPGHCPSGLVRHDRGAGCRSDG